MPTIIGSARIDEHGHLSGGSAGDQKQKAADDYTGEVSKQNFYVHKLGWYIIRCKHQTYADLIAKAMTIACDNPNIGYDQGNRLAIMKDGVKSTKKTECDCSSLVRACLKYAGITVDNFNTYNEATKIMATGMFDKIKFVSESKTPLQKGDILVTMKKGHTVVVLQTQTQKNKNERKEISLDPCYFAKYLGTTNSIVNALTSIGAKSSFSYRKEIAKKNNIAAYVGTATQNKLMLNLLKNGKLLKP